MGVIWINCKKKNIKFFICHMKIDFYYFLLISVRNMCDLHEKLSCTITPGCMSLINCEIYQRGWVSKVSDTELLLVIAHLNPTTRFNCWCNAKYVVLLAFISFGLQLLFNSFNEHTIYNGLVNRVLFGLCVLLNVVV